MLCTSKATVVNRTPRGNSRLKISPACQAKPPTTWMPLRTLSNTPNQLRCRASWCHRWSNNKPIVKAVKPKLTRCRRTRSEPTRALLRSKWQSVWTDCSWKAIHMCPNHQFRRTTTFFQTCNNSSKTNSSLLTPKCLCGSASYSWRKARISQFLHQATMNRVMINNE